MAFFSDINWDDVMEKNVSLIVQAEMFFLMFSVSLLPHQLTPPLVPPRGEVNAADAFDIGSFDSDETRGIKVQWVGPPTHSFINMFTHSFLPSLSLSSS